MTPIGSAIGVSVSTIVFNSVLRTQSKHFGVMPDAQADNVPLPAQLKAYKAAMWTGFAFGILCAYCVDAPKSIEFTLILVLLFTGTVLCVFLRGAGIVGQRPAQDLPAHLNPEDGVPVDEMGHDSADQKHHSDTQVRHDELNQLMQPHCP